MQYLRAYTAFFESPNWGMNLLLGAVCMLIPVVGPIAYMGYMCVVLEHALRRGQPPYPDFGFGQFGTYLGRGIWPFLAALVLGLATSVLFLPCTCVSWVGLVIGAEAADRPAGSPTILLLAIGLMVAVYLLEWTLILLVQVPMMLRSGLGRNFAGAFDFHWIRGFLRRVWIETLLASLFLMVSGLVLGLLGFCCCLVGMYPAMALVTFGSWVLWLQIYELYLARGGEPVPLKEG